MHVGYNRVLRSGNKLLPGGFSYSVVRYQGKITRRNIFAHDGVLDMFGNTMTFSVDITAQVQSRLLSLKAFPEL